jgi:hypothetical protein
VFLAGASLGPQVVVILPGASLGPQVNDIQLGNHHVITVVTAQE